MRVLRDRRGKRHPTLSLEPAEAGLIVHLADQVASLLRSSAGETDAADPVEGSAAASTAWADEDEGVLAPDDPALLRLLPDAYADDESSREFRRFTSNDLSAQKLANLARVVDDVRGAAAEKRPGEIALTPDSLGAWLRALTDLRLVLASRLGMDADGEVPANAAPGVEDVYDWLGFVQESVLQVLED